MIVQGSSYWLQLANRAELPKGLLLFFLTHFIRNQWKLNGFFGLSKLGWLKKNSHLPGPRNEQSVVTFSTEIWHLRCTDLPFTPRELPSTLPNPRLPPGLKKKLCK